MTELLGNFELREWQQGADPQQFRMAIHHDGTDAEIDSYVEMTEKVVAEAIGVFGELPRFDFGAYTFLVDYLPWAQGDAMEHRNSTPLVSSQRLEDSALALLETLAHEFIHTWNVERIRPASLEPFNFDDVTHSDSLWFAEGFTNYYDGLPTLQDKQANGDQYDTHKMVSPALYWPGPGPDSNNAAGLERSLR